jgi:hypothetical protein
LKIRRWRVENDGKIVGKEVGIFEDAELPTIRSNHRSKIDLSAVSGRLHYDHSCRTVWTSTANQYASEGGDHLNVARCLKSVDAVFLVIVAASAATMASFMFWSAYQHPELLWRGDPSDRSVHFGLGLSLALAAKNHDLTWFWYELEFARLWPPFHGLMLFPVLLIGGFDFRLGVIPSLLGWTITIVMTWLITRSFFEDRRKSIFGAIVAVIYASASPSFRLLATDVMLECLGSALTAVSVYLFMQTYNGPSQKLKWRLLALVLTCLFFEKYNYWGLLFVSLTLTLLIQNWTVLNEHARKEWNFGARIARGMAKDPAVIISGVLVLLVLYIYWQHIQIINIFGWKISVFPPMNLTTIAYAVLFGRLAVAWVRHRGWANNALGTAGRAIFYFHLVPVAVSFLLPGRLSWFLWFVGPTNTFYAEHDPWSGVVEYYRGFTEGFSVAPWAGILALVLTSMALAQWRRFPPRCQVIFVMLVTFAALLVLHPNHQARFLASWVFSVWVCTGVGAVLVFQWAARCLRWPLGNAALAVCAIAGLGWATAVTKPSWALAGAVAHQTTGPTEFDLLPAVIPYLAGSERIGLLPESFGKNAFLVDAVMLQCRCRIRTDAPGDLKNFSHAETIRQMSIFVESTDSDVILGVFMPINAVPNEWLIEAMNAQNRFDLVADHFVASQHADVMIWQKKRDRKDS